MLLFAFNGLVFLLLGLELPRVVSRIAGVSWQELAVHALVLWVALNVLRILWVYPAAHLPPLLVRRIRESEGFRNPAGIFLVGWAGLRGSVTMAAALSIPLITAAGAPFPGRDLIIFLAGATIVLTLVINGLTLPWLIRILDLHGDGNAQREERAARIAIAQAASSALRESLPKLKRVEEIALAQRLIDDLRAPDASPLRQRQPPHGPGHAGRRRTQAAARRAARRAPGTARDARVRRHQRRNAAGDRSGNRSCGIVRRAHRIARPRLMAMSAPVAMLGGTFDPVHYGHLRFADDVRRTLRLDEVRLVPGRDPPHRAGPAASTADRLAMLRLAVVEFPGLVVDERELQREGKSYTVLTLEALRREDPERPLWLLLGADAFRGLPTWHRWQEVFALAHIVVVARPGVALADDLPESLAAQWRMRMTCDPSILFSTPAGAIFEERVSPQPIAATAIRAQLARGSTDRQAVAGLLPPAVLAYIEQHHLYSIPPDAP